MSRKSNKSRWSLRKRSSDKYAGIHGTGRVRRVWRVLEVEGLETRTLLAVTASVTGSTAVFRGEPADGLYLETDSAGLLEYHGDGGSFSSNLGGSTINLQSQDTTVQVYVGGTLHLDGLFTAGKSLSINGPVALTDPSDPKAHVAIESTIDTQGGDLSIINFSSIEVGTSTAGATVSTRNLKGGTNYLTGASQGDSGALTMTVENPDPNNPFLNIGFNTPQITVDAGSNLLTQATGSNQPGAITLTATNTNYTLDGLSFPTLGGAVRQSTVDFADGTTSSASLVEGGTIDINATSGDIPLVATYVSNNTPQNSDDQFASWGPWAGGLASTAGQLASYLPGLNLATLPVSINYRNAASTVTVGQYTQIIGAGDVTVVSTSTADAEGQAIYSRGTQFGAAVAFMMGVTDAETNVNSNALIDSTSGSVTLNSTANTTATPIARVSQNIGNGSTNPDSIAVALAVGVVNQTAQATVSSGATVKAAGDVNLTATGTGANTSIPTTGTYVTGLAGAALGVNVTENTIKANADGTLISGASATAPTLILDPDTAVDFAHSAFEVSPGAFASLQTGQPYTYSSGNNGAIGGLRSGTVYYIIVPTNLTDEIQLAATLHDAEQGNFIPFQQYPTLTGGSTSVPISDVNETDGTITFDSNPGFTDGEPLTYHAVAGQLIGGLTDGTPYYAIVKSASPDTLQLAAAAPVGGVDGPAIPLNLDPEFQGFQQRLPVTVNPSGGLTNSIQLGFNAGFQLNDSFIYQGSGISGLTDGVRYWAIPDSSNPDVIQLADSYSDAVAGNALPIGSNAGGSDGSATLTFDPSVSIDSDTNTIDLGFNYALAGTLPTDTPLVYHGALGSTVANLTDGATYYVIQDPANPRIMHLTALTTDPLNNNASYAQEAYNAAVTALTANAAAATPFLVNIDSSTNPANTLDFGSQAAFDTNDVLIYEGPTGSNPAVSGLTPGATYYALVPDPTKPGVIQLTNSTGAVQPISLPSGATTTTVEFITAKVAAGLSGGAIASARVGNPPPVGTFPVTVDPLGQTVDFGFNAGFVKNQPLVYEGPADGDLGIIGLTPGDTYDVTLPDRVNHPGLVQFIDGSGNTVPVSLASGTTTSVMFGAPTSDNVSVSSNQLTFNNPDEPTTPFDPGFNLGDPMVYLGPESPSNGDVGITGLVPGTVYYVITTSTPGVIQLADSYADAELGTALPISLPSGSTATNINYTVPFTPADTRPLVVTQFGSIDTATMSFTMPFTASPTTLTPVGMAGVNVTATLTDSESSFTASGIGDEPSVADKILKPELVAPQTNSAIQNAWSKQFNSGSSSAATTVTQNAPGATGQGPDLSLAGAVFIQVVPVDIVTAEVASTAVIESASNVTVAASLTQTVDTSATAALTGQAGASPSGNSGLAGALALGIGYYTPTVHATIDSGAQVDAAGTLAVTATTMIPFEVPTTVNGVEGDIVYNPANPNYNPLNFVTSFLTDGMLGLGTDILNNSASAKVDPTDEAETAIGGNIQVFVYVNDTEATIGDAQINQKVSDPNVLGTGQGISFQNASQSVTVQASTQYENAAEAGAFDLNLSPVSLIKNIRAKGFKQGAGSALNLYGDVSGTNAVGASVFVDALDNTTLATIDTGAKIGVGSAGTLDVDADQQIIAFSLVQSGDAGGNIGVAGMAAWYNVTSDTQAQIQDGVTVNGGYDANGNPLQGGVVDVQADDNTFIVGITGGAVKSNHIGVGFAMAVNNVNRKTLALIGSTSTPVTPGSYDISALHVNATDEGVVATVTYSAATVSPSEGQVKQSNNNPIPTLSGTKFAGTTYAQLGITNPSAQPSGYGISGAVSANVMQSDTEAYVNDTGRFTTPSALAPLSLDPTAQPATVINFSQPPNLPTGTPVVYTAASPIGRLTSVTTYYVIATDPYDLELAATAADAAAGTAIALDPSTASGTQTLTPASGSALTFTPSAVEATVLDFAAPHGLQTGQALEYMAGSAAIGGLTSGQTYYAILIGPNQIELADSLANALGGQALALDFSKASGSQTFLPITFTINAATQTIVVSVAGGVALSRQQTGSFSSNNAIAGALSTDDIIDKTKAYLENAMVTTAALDVTADHGGYIGSLTAGAAGATGGTGSNNAVAGSVSVDVDLPVTEAYVQDATLTLGGDSSVKANEAAEIAAIAGSGAYGGSKGFGVAIAINLIGFNLDGTSDPATTAAFIQDSTVTLDTGTLSITATDAGPTIQPQIIAITGSGGVATGSDSIGGGGMIAVNDIQDETNAYVVGSTITQPSGASALANLDVEATDSSGIIAIGGALGVGGEAGLGAAIGFNVIAATTSAYIDSSTIDVNGTVTVTATDTAVIGSATIGVGVTTGDGGLAGAGSVSINQITDTTDAHISNTLDTTSSVTAGGTVTVTAKDTSTIGSVAGDVAGASEGAAVGAAISYNLIQNSILAYVDDSTVTTGGDLDLSATSSPVLVAVAVGAAGTGSGFALGGSITVNAIANDVDTHISDSTVDAHGSVSLMAIESAVMVVVAGAVAISLEGAAVGGAIAYNYIGGSFDPADPDLTGTASTTTSSSKHQVSATITGSQVTAGGNVTVAADFGPPPELPGSDASLDFGYTQVTIPIDVSSELVSVAVGAAAAQGVAVAGSLNLNFVRESVVASITTDSVVQAGGSGGVLVTASDSATIVAVSGGLALGVGLEGDAGVAVGISAAHNDIANTVQAYVDGSAVTAAAGSVQLQATEGATITAWTIGGAVGVGVGADGVGVGLAGAGSGNTIADDVEAYAQDGATLTAQDGNVSLLASDSPTITANGGGVAISGGIGTGGVGVSLGVGFAINTITDTVKAYVDTAQVTAAGAVSLAALEAAQISGLTIGGAVAVAGGGGGVGVAVAGSTTIDTVQDDVEAYIRNSNGTNGVTAQGGGVSLSATDNTTITTSGGGVGIAAAGGGVAVAGAVGFAVVTNTVTNQVLAYVDGSDVTAVGGDMALAATETPTITAVSAGGAVSIAGGATAAAGAGAGGSSTNTVDNTVEAYLADGASVTTTTSGDVTLTATDTPNATAETVGAALAIAASAAGAGSLSIGAAIANNTITDTVHATSDGAMIQSAGAVQLTATAQPTATALSVAASLSLALAPTSFSFAGGGASSTNQIDNDVESHILGAGAASPSTVVAVGAVNLSATETGSVDATVGSGAVTFGLVGASVGASLSQNTIDSTIEAEIDNAQVTGGSIQVEATATDMVQPTKTIATSVAISLGGAGAGGDASATVSPTVQAVVGGGAILNTPGDLSITSSSNSTAAAQNTGVAGGLIAVGDSKAEATIGGETSSTVVAGASLTAGGNLSVTATSTQSANASATADAGGIGVGADATATVMVTPTVQAVVGDETGANTAQTTLTAGKSIMVSSSETTTEANATSTNNAGGGIVGGTPTSTTTVNDSSNAALGGNGVATVALGNFTLSALAEDDGVKSEADASGGGSRRFRQQHRHHEPH